MTDNEFWDRAYLIGLSNPSLETYSLAIQFADEALAARKIHHDRLCLEHPENGLPLATGSKQ